ncbi:MAG TPA: hypothetical protein VFQ93_08270 [Casimicrobiaceae bacterium]|nr:hypothetical protein [Casimicrobiaceae bacterium]
MAITATCREKSNVRVPSVLCGSMSAGGLNGARRPGAFAGVSRSSDSIHAMLVFSRSARAFCGYAPPGSKPARVRTRRADRTIGNPILREYSSALAKCLTAPVTCRVKAAAMIQLTVL